MDLELKLGILGTTPLRSVSAESQHMVLILRVKEVVRTHPSQASTRTIACLAMLFSVAIDLIQLYHAPWLDSIRQTTLGGLILGFGFLWIDLMCYVVGVGIGALIESIGGIVPRDDRR
jgi:hypothetical protein